MSDSPTATSVAEPTAEGGAAPNPPTSLTRVNVAGATTARAKAKPANSAPPADVEENAVPVAREQGDGDGGGATGTAGGLTTDDGVLATGDAADGAVLAGGATADDGVLATGDAADSAVLAGGATADGGALVGGGAVGAGGAGGGAVGRRFSPSRMVRGFRPGIVSGLVVVALVLAAGTGWLGLTVRAQRERQADARAATAVAEQITGTLWTVDANSSKDVFATLLSKATGGLKAQMSQASGTFQQVLTQQKVSSSGSVVSSGITGQTKKRATVLVAVNASITGSDGKTQLRQYRMQASVVKSGNRWLVSDLEFVA